MKKTVLHLIILCFLSSVSLAQAGTPDIVPSPTLKSQVLPGNPDISLGYKPAPFKLDFRPRPAGDMRYKSSAALPAKFDLRAEGRVTPVKKQGGGNYGGNCTAFASMGSVESRWLSMGFEEVDLSEQNMAACNGFDTINWGFGMGANQFICSAYLTRFDGPVLESDDPYNLEVHSCRDTLVPHALVPDSRWLPVRDFELLKRTIYYYGAVYAGIHWDPTGESYIAGDSTYCDSIYCNPHYCDSTYCDSFNRENIYTYYYSGNNPANHAVLVCGWDDDMATAGGSGAWIVKNSWDTTWADKGFFYISYQDMQFAADEMAYFPVRWEINEVDTTYMYDNLGFTAKLPSANISRVFELAMFTAPEEQLLTHVGVCVPDPETVLDFEIYNDFDGEQLTNPMGSREDLYIEIPGIYTFELPVTVDGDFYVQVTREVGTEEVNHPIETYDEGFSDPVIEAGVNWIRRDGENNWRPSVFGGSGTGFNLTIRAYAKTTTAPRALFMTDKKEACLGSELTYTYLENNPAGTFEWDFGKDATPAAASTKGPHMVSYSSEGTKTVSLKVSGTGGADSVVRHDYIDVVPAIRVNILKSTMSFQQGQTVRISAYGADSYEWSPASMVDNTTGQSVMVTPPYAGTHKLYVTGTQGSCTGSDSIEIMTTNKPPNDDMCDALLIKNGGWIGKYSNEFATAEVNEPAPDEGDCFAPMTWCEEEGVQNSLWFYFYGPPTGIASLRTTGMDNQIAVYRADTCTEIIKDSLVAANDDYTPKPNEELAATLDAVSVTPGAKYFVQIDGSAGGEKGTFVLYFYAYPTGLEEQEVSVLTNASLSVYPNPGRDIFNIRLDGALSPDVDVILYNLNGQLIMRKSFHNVQGELFTRLDLSRQASGIYHLRVIDGNRIIDRKLVRE